MSIVLELDPECLSRPTRLDLATIEAMMLWPNDSEARQRWWRSCALEELGGRIDDMPVEAVREYAKDAMTLPRISVMREHHEKMWWRGYILGVQILEATVLATLAPERASLRRVQADIARRFKGKFQIEPRTMNNKTGPLAPLRPAAHFWAAHVCMTSRIEDLVFPCRKAEIGRFLALAEKFRNAAEKSRAPKANTTILRPGESVRLAASLVALLPDVPIRFRMISQN